jgi:hypothetical protein
MAFLFLSLEIRATYYTSLGCYYCITVIQFFCVDYLMKQSVLRLYSISKRIINDYGAVGGKRIGRGDWNNLGNPPPMLFC